MPLVRIEVLEGRTGRELEAIGIPPLDRFQVIPQHPPGRLVFDPQDLGVSRTSGVVVVPITFSAGRTLEQKRSLYAAIARILSSGAGVRPEDVFVNLVEVGKENWSFGNGVA